MQPDTVVYMPVIPAFGRLRSEDEEFKASLEFIRPCVIFCFTPRNHFSILVGNRVSLSSSLWPVAHSYQHLFVVSICSCGHSAKSQSSSSSWLALLASTTIDQPVPKGCVCQTSQREIDGCWRWIWKVWWWWISSCYSKGSLQDLPGKLQEVRVCSETEGHLNIIKIGAPKAAKNPHKPTN